jgi:LysR family hydrogen peroxide-inducible transcriptional activator
MELRQLRYFCAVVDEGSFTAAAAACAIAQPSLSQQILNLEHEMGQPLLIRHPRRVELTDAGQAVIRRARLILAESDSLREDMERRIGLIEGTVHVGVIPTVAPYLLPVPIRRFHRKYPGVKIHVREGRTSRVLQELASGRIDFAIVSDVTSTDRERFSLNVAELFKEKLVLALPQAHALAHAEEAVAIKDIPKEELIVLSEGHCLTDQTLSVCRLHRSDEHLECEQLETLLALVRTGLGLAIVPEMAVKNGSREGIVIRPFKSPEPKRLISIVNRRAGSLSPAANAFLEEFSSKLHG